MNSGAASRSPYATAGGTRIMSGDSLIERLVEEVLDSNRTAEEVCTEHPEILREVQERLRRCREIEAQLEAIFPSSHATSSGSFRPLPFEGGLPQIPDFEVESILGNGGMGVVYKAKQLKLNRTVA